MPQQQKEKQAFLKNFFPKEDICPVVWQINCTNWHLLMSGYLLEAAKADW